MGLMTYEYQSQMPTNRLYEVSLTTRDGATQVSRVRAKDAASAAKVFTTKRMAAKWGFTVNGVVPA